MCFVEDQKGFDLAMIMKKVGSMLQAQLDLDSVLGTAGGPSSVVLIVPHSSATVSNTDADYIYSRLTELRQTVPGTRLHNSIYYRKSLPWVLTNKNK